MTLKPSLNPSCEKKFNAKRRRPIPSDSSVCGDYYEGELIKQKHRGLPVTTRGLKPISGDDHLVYVLEGKLVAISPLNAVNFEAWVKNGGPWL